MSHLPAGKDPDQDQQRPAEQKLICRNGGRALPVRDQFQRHGTGPIGKGTEKDQPFPRQMESASQASRRQVDHDHSGKPDDTAHRLLPGDFLGFHQEMGHKNSEKCIGGIDHRSLGPGRIRKSDIETHVLDGGLQDPLAEHIGKRRPPDHHQPSLQPTGQDKGQDAGQEKPVSGEQNLAACPFHLEHLISNFYTRKCAAP